MTVKDLIKELQKYPEDYEVKIPAHLDVVAPDDIPLNDIDEVNVNYIVLPIIEINENINDKYIYLLFDIEEYAKYDFYKNYQQKQKGH